MNDNHDIATPDGFQGVEGNLQCGMNHYLGHMRHAMTLLPEHLSLTDAFSTFMTAPIGMMSASIGTLAAVLHKDFSTSGRKEPMDELIEEMVRLTISYLQESLKDDATWEAGRVRQHSMRKGGRRG